MTDTVEQEVEQEVEVNEVENAIREAFDIEINGESDEDLVKMGMIQAGATFKNVTRLYNQFMVDAGLAISKADRNQIIEDTLEGRDFESEDNFALAVEDLAEAVTGATDRSAAAMIRAYAKKNELECYTKPKGTGATRSGFTSKLYDFLAENPRVEESEVIKFVNGDGDYAETSDNTRKHISSHLGVWKLVQRVVESCA